MEQTVKKVVTFTATKVVNEKDKVQTTIFFVESDGYGFETTDFNLAFQAFISRI